MSLSAESTEPVGSVAKNPKTETSAEKLTAFISDAEWDQAAKIVYGLKPSGVVCKYCIFLLARTQFIEILESNDLVESTMFLKTLGAFTGRAQPPPWLNKTDRINPLMFELAASSKANSAAHSFLPVSTEAQKALFRAKICSFFAETPTDFCFSYPGRMSHFGVLDPFDAFERAYYGARRGEGKMALSALFLLDFLLTRAISEEVGNLGLGLLMPSDLKGFLAMCREVTPALPVDRAGLAKKIISICEVDNTVRGSEKEKNSPNPQELTSTLLWSSTPKNSEIWEIKFSPNGRFLIAAEKFGTMTLYSVPPPTRVSLQTDAENAAQSVKMEFSQKIAGSDPFSAELSEIGPNFRSFQPTLLRRFNGVSEVTSIIWSPDSAYFVCCSRQGVEVWKTENFELNPIYTSKKFTAVAASWFSDSKTFLLADSEGLFIFSIFSLNRFTPFLALKQIANVIISSPAETNLSAQPPPTPDPIETGRNRPISAENTQKIILGTTDGRFFVSFAPFSRFFLFLHFPVEIGHFWLSFSGDLLTVHTESDIQRWDIAQITPEFISATHGFDKTSHPSLIPPENAENAESPTNPVPFSAPLPFPPASRKTRHNANEADAHGRFERPSAALPWSPAVSSDAIACRLEALVDSADGNGRDELFGRVCPCFPDSRRTAALLASARNWPNLLSARQRGRLAKVYTKEIASGECDNDLDFKKRGAGRVVRAGGRGGAELVRRLAGARQRRVVVKSCGVGDTSLVLSGSEDGMVYAWAAGAETPAVGMPGHTATVNAVDAVVAVVAGDGINNNNNGAGGAWQGSGRKTALVASASDDGTVCLWRVSGIV